MAHTSHRVAGNNASLKEGLKNSIAPYLKRFELREING